MKKFRSILLLAICLLFVLSPVVSAAQPYQTYTYSKKKDPLRSPDVYSPDKVIDADYMGLADFYPEIIIPAQMEKDMLKDKLQTFQDLKKKNDDLRQIGDLRDIFVDKNNNVYLVDAKCNRVIVLDRYYKIKFILSEFNNDFGVPDTFTNPSGIFVTDEYMYICDTDANRIAMFDLDGNFYKMIYAPESDLFRELHLQAGSGSR